MKKILLSCLSFACIFLFGGCSLSGDNEAITSLNNQLDSVQTSVASTSVQEIADVSPSVTLESDQPYNSIQSFRALSNEKMLREEEIRQKILTLTQTLKSCTNQKYKLGKKKAEALKDLSSNLGKYSSHLNETKSRVKNSVRQIKKNLKVTNINIEEASSGYVTLNNSMNERYAYLCNIYDNLEQASIILDCDCHNCDEECCDEQADTNISITKSTMPDSRFDEDYSIGKITDDEERTSNKFAKNIDSYKANNGEKQAENIDTNYPQTPVNPQPQPLPRPYPVGNPHYGNYNGYYGNGYYNGGIINPSRNTDTFYQFNRNIDTYRYSPNFYKGYGY